jgi:tRNA synthetase class II core domain (G, H, P, S and T)
MSTQDARLDHRDLNRDLHVFATDPLAGAGLPLWLPDGAVIREELQSLARDLARADGCHGVYSPVLGKRALYERSGHWAKFGDDMFPPMAVGGDELVLRPANCPHHALIYASARRSWRELPLRLNELAAMFRAERSGVLSGLSRVRQVNLDDRRRRRVRRRRRRGGPHPARQGRLRGAAAARGLAHCRLTGPALATTAASGGITSATADITTAAVTENRQIRVHASTISSTHVPIMTR